MCSISVFSVFSFFSFFSFSFLSPSGVPVTEEEEEAEAEAEEEEAEEDDSINWCNPTNLGANHTNNSCCPGVLMSIMFTLVVMTFINFNIDKVISATFAALAVPEHRKEALVVK
jgi:hypothetical protein